MDNKLAQSDGLPEVLGTGIDQSWKTHTIHLDPLLHDALTQEHLQRIVRLQDVLREVKPMTLDGWTEEIMLDIHPEQEISILESVAVVYLKLSLNTKLVLEEKTSLYRLLCAMSFGARHRDVNKYIPKGLPSASKIHKMFCKALEDFERP